MEKMRSAVAFYRREQTGTSMADKEGPIFIWTDNQKGKNVIEETGIGPNKRKGSI